MSSVSVDYVLEVKVMALSEVEVGGSAVVASLELPHEVLDHLMHLGFLPDAIIDVLRRAPAGDPTVYRVEGAEIALRRETARHIHVRRPDRIPDQTPDQTRDQA
jgi:Fe2+ transport system protein FeoA